jgi:hypothetical protein
MADITSALGRTGQRAKLIGGLLQYRDLIIGLGYQDGFQFIDGSFVEDVERRESRDPLDIDVFSFLVRPPKYRSDPNSWETTGFSEWSNEIVNRTQNKTRFGLDTYAIAVDQTPPLNVIKETIYWYSLFSHKRVTHEWKGFLCVTLDQADNAAAKALLQE